jgi:hypothetical protein
MNAIPRPALPLMVLAVVLSGAACSTQPHRIRQYPDSFDRLPDKRQAQIRKGMVATGYTPLEVYMALGPPNGQATLENPPFSPGDTWAYDGRWVTTRDGSRVFRSFHDFVFHTPGRLTTLRVTFDESQVVRLDTDSPDR